MQKKTITQLTCEFLERLSNNNNREWFTANKEEYTYLQKELNYFVESLIDGIADFDADVNAHKPAVKDCTYRIYRDIRFSKDKQPYKTHIGIYINRGGKKSPYGGYYFHIEPAKGKVELGHSVSEYENIDFSRSLLASGLYSPQPKILASLRDEISVNGDSFLDAMKLAKDFKLYNHNKLKKLPKGFDNINEQWQELLKHKDFFLMRYIDDDFLYSPDLLSLTLKEFKKTYEFNRITNLAVDYALEQL